MSTEPPLIKQEKTTSRTTEADIRSELESTTQNTDTHLNMNTQVTEDKQRRKSRSCSYIVIPVIFTSIVVCIGCVVGL
ncbi:uncharacterized protein DC041_0000739 [Schistosoma bovis]|uniref:Uncharacterized protein n=1 Tax=Schistosoma bovis TaxID=6184 RepID=A0A430QA23_SCHBO|nr:uncharacterized protein DC041_0000739 [Schistosoma bovis]